MGAGWLARAVRALVRLLEVCGRYESERRMGAVGYAPSVGARETIS